MTASPVAEAQDVCASDPNFAVIFAFCERFGDSCGVAIPTFQELQEMLEKTTEVPDALVDLHIKLLRRVKKSVNADKWERAVLKFCQEYSVPEFWELENYGYKGISVKLKLRILKTLFEAQFDSNVKFKSEINKLESSTLHSQPLGWDRSGVAYWVQFDRACNLRVYKEDIDEDTWEIVAKDRSTLVNLINELSGAKDNTLDDIEDSNSIESGSEGGNELPSSLNSEKPSPIIENNIKEYSTTESKNVELDSQENPLDKPINFKQKLNEDDDLSNKNNIPIVGEEIEESVMIVKGEGSGQECDTGNPDETNTQNDTSKNEDVKKPKLWSIEAICSSSKEVKEEIVSVPKTGFFFGDDSVPCFNNVSNGEDSSCIDGSKLKDIEEWKKSKISDEELNKNMKTDEELCTNKKNNEEINKNEKLDEVDTTTPHSIKSLNLDEFSCKNVSKQSVFNIKVHEEEVQITERKANEVFTKSETSIKHNTTNVYGSTSFGSYSKPQESQINSITEIIAHNKDNQSQISSKINTHDADHKTECKKIEVDQTNDLPTDLTNSDILKNTKVEEKKNLSVKLEENTKCNIDQQLEENKKEEKDQQPISKIVGEPVKTNKHTLDNKIQLTEQLTTSKSSQSDEKKILYNRCEKIKTNESFANTVGQYDDINEQPSSYVVEQNACLLDTSISNLADQSTISDDQILENKSVIDDEKLKDNLVEENKPDNQVTEHIEHTQITDDLETNTTYSNSDLNQHTESDNSIINPIASSSKAYDQTLSNNVDQCPQISKQADSNQNTNKSKKTSHNISNIIDTNTIVISDSVKANEPPSNYINTEIKQLENFTNEKNVIQEKKPSVVNVDCPKVFNSKHSLNNILQKLDDVKEISECPNTESSNVDFEIDKIDSVKSEVEIKEELNLKSKDVLKDLTILKEDKIIENKKNISPIIASVPENKKEVIDVLTKETKSDRDYELSTISTEQHKKHEIKQGGLNVNYVEKIQNKDLKEKQKLFKIVNDTDTYIHNKEKLNLEELKSAPCNKDNLVYDSSLQDSTLKTESRVEINEEGAVDILHGDKNVINKSIKNDENLENKEKDTNFDKEVINQNLKIEINSEDDEENTLKSSEEQIDTSPVQEGTCENSDETNQETFNKSPKEEFDDSVAVDQTFEEDIKSDEEEVAEETPKKKGRPGRKKGKRGRAKKAATVKQENKSITEEKVKRPYKPRQKKVVTISEEVTVFPEPAGDDNVRRSRRIAEIKIKEQFIPATQYDDIDIPLKSPKKKDKGGKKGSTPSKKLENAEESDDEDEEDPISKKFKKKRRKGKSDSLKKINMVNPWNVDSESSSSENNIELFEDYDHEEEEEIPRPGIEPNISDHEFSPESDINDEDEEYLPEKRARTAHKKDEGELLKDDMCQKCNKSDQPEWILLCDTCNQGWHASCLRPPLMVIPDGDWYCPPCRHQALLNALKETLKKYDGESKKRENEELRRKRLAYVGISLQNVISSKTEEVKSDKSPVVHQSSEDDEEESESEDYDSEPLYTLRARRQANVSYRFNDYDDMINEAILEETGVDESAAKKSAELKTDKNDNDEKNDSDNDENDKDREDSPIAPALLHLRGRKKSKKLTNLDISSDDGSDEDFKGPSDGDDDYEEDLSEYSDDSVKRRPQPTRRSVRNRKNVVDPDFINDDSSEESDQRSKKKRSRPWSDSSNSEEEDLTWGKRKKKRTNAYSSSSLSSKPATKGSKRKRSENDGVRKFKKSTIKFGMNSDSDSDGQPKRRTRGRQITYAESDDSEEEVQTKKRKVASDEEDEYVLNDDELEVENEDHTLEVEEDDAVASNEEKDDDDDDVGEDEVVDEEEEDEDEEEEVDTKPAIAAAPSAPAPPSHVAHQTVAKLPPPPAVVQSVIREPVPSSSSDLLVAEPHHNPPHPRLLAPVAVQRLDKQEPPAVADPAAHGSPDKRKRPQHQPKKCPSPNPLVDYGGGAGYPYAPDATKVTVSAVPPSPAFVRPPVAAVVPAAAGVFKTMVPRTAGDMGFSAVPVPYRAAANKMTGPAGYLPPPPPPQVQQIYQAPTSTPPPPQPQPPATGYTPYPIDYAAAGASLPPPPPLIPFRNVVVVPPLQEHALLPSAAHQQPPQQSAAAGGDSEFGGLVSYFSSQQEDDFDT